MNISDLIKAGGSTGRMLQYEIANASKNITILHDGVADVMVIGGHGGGAAVGRAGYATGASAGELAVAFGIPVKRNDVLTASIGIGGPQVVAAPGAVVNGNDAGDTTLVLPGRTILTKGGKGAKASLTLPLQGPRGGYGGNGGDLHIEGGPGGSVIATPMAYGVAGSGAPGVLLNLPADRAGGSINTTVTSTVNAGSGAGVGGKGGGLLAESIAGGQTTGGGSGGPGANATETGSGVVRAGVNYLGEQRSESPTALVQSMAAMWGLDYFGGGALSTARPAGPGGGGLGTLPSATAKTADAGAFGGPGGVVASSGGATVAGMAANNGPGGSIVCNTGNIQVIGTAGWPGLVVVVVREG